jgi:serine protease DegQ
MTRGGDVNRVTRRRATLLLATMLCCAALLASCTDSDPLSDEAPTTTEAPTEDEGADAQIDQGTSEGGSPFDRIPDIVDEVQPSVVAVQAGSGEGSGVVWDEDGTIVTNHHVVAGGRDFTIVFADGQRSDAELLASDPLTDLAVLRAERRDLPPADFAADLPEVGELAIAIGNPLGFENTVTAGIVSGLHRSIPGSAASSQSLIDLVQTDAAISPGNSGGALVNGRGQVIGINVAYIPPSARAVSIGFAIPSATVIDVVEQLLDDGTVSHAFFGVQPTALTPQIARQLGAEVDEGVVVLGVVRGGPAAEAGIEEGDIVTQLDGDEVRAVEEFLALLRDKEPGDEVTVGLVRDGGQEEVTVTLTDRPEG